MFHKANDSFPPSTTIPSAKTIVLLRHANMSQLLKLIPRSILKGNLDASAYYEVWVGGVQANHKATINF